MKKIFKLLFLINIQIIINSSVSSNNCTVFVPRQLSYNPVLENALTFVKTKELDCWQYLFSFKPVYSQSVGNKFDRYFNIDHKNVMQVREDGSGDIDSLWMQVISSNSTFYSSDLSFNPVRRTVGTMLFFEAKFPHHLSLSINTALVNSKNNMNICEKNIENEGTVTGNSTITQSLSNNDRKYGKICGGKCKTNLDDIQIKLLGRVCNTDKYSWDIYGLLGIPTSSGTKSVYLFEPLVGSKHAQLGLGTYYERDLGECYYSNFKFLSELKWRYAFHASERRLFDLKSNGQWSRYMLLVNKANKFNPFFASNALALKSRVTPKNSLDIYLAFNVNHNNCNFELGYDFWFRNAEKVRLKYSKKCMPVVFAGAGVADLLGIAKLSPQSASTANISQSVESGNNQMISDLEFVQITTDSLNICSGSAARAISNSLYGCAAYNYKCMQFGLNLAYEQGCGTNTPNNIFGWLNFDFSF